ncbi:MAG: hypothetical protein ABIA63_11715, partial [bacterium]
MVFPVIEFSISGAYGYTHYNPDDLNDVNRIFERISREAAGFKGYTVEPFNGHSEYALSIGLSWKQINVALES